jgi:hypothetical protein
MIRCRGKRKRVVGWKNGAEKKGQGKRALAAAVAE